MKEVKVNLGEIEYGKREKIPKKISLNTDRWIVEIERKESLIIYSM